MCPCDLRHVPCLSQGSHQHATGHPLERAYADHVLCPVHANLRESHRVSGIPVDLGVLLHHGQRERQEAVNGRDHSHGTGQTYGYVPGRIPGLLGHGSHHVEAGIGPVHDGRSSENTPGAVREEGDQIGGVGMGKPHHQDEHDHHGAEHGSNPIQSGSMPSPGDGYAVRYQQNYEGERVQQVKALAQTPDLNPQEIGVVIDHAGEIGGP
ncbi:hypothetical protein MLD38_002308 [Melastoma candidum]|uniref:Uncharacterized protein n=1 Tax=Melastoma candidum TaxID=119954 RepID=A0ACB9SK17_9MYRT|nr:hypothetical protein MLD38_002308 [Melastoma candidum]